MQQEPSLSGRWSLIVDPSSLALIGWNSSTIASANEQPKVIVGWLVGGLLAWLVTYLQPKVMIGRLKSTSTNGWFHRIATEMMVPSRSLRQNGGPAHSPCIVGRLASQWADSGWWFD